MMKDVRLVNHAATFNGGYAASDIEAAERPDKMSRLAVTYHSEGHISNPVDMPLQLYTRGCAFSGMYDDVSYPVTTVFCPPHPPGEFPPRVQLPPRPGPLWKNDISAAGKTEHNAQTKVSKVWRGILARRDLHNSRTYEHIISCRARMIQCWWRTILARRRYCQLVALKQEWYEARAEAYVSARKQNLEMALTWQRRRFEGAAITLQRTVRWFLRQLVINRLRWKGVLEEELPESLPYPVSPAHRSYFPWRRRHGAAGRQLSLKGDSEDGGGLVPKEEPRRRTILEFKKSKESVPPPEQEEVEGENEKMRHRSRGRAVSLAAPEVQSRQEWKREGLRKADLDFNAGVIQRAIQAKRSTSKVRTAELTQNYMNNVSRIIARSFRIYTLVQRIQAFRRTRESRVRERLTRYSNAKIAEIDHQLVWGKGLLDACATTIQRCWHWYRYDRFGVLPLHIRKELEQHEAIRQQKATGDVRAGDAQGEAATRLQSEPGVTVQSEGGDPAADEKRTNDSSNNGNGEGQLLLEGGRPTSAAFANSGGRGAEGTPGEGEYVYEEPQPPPYNMIDDFLAREEDLRDAMMNMLERNQKEVAKKHKYVRFVPDAIIERRRVGVLVKR